MEDRNTSSNTVIPNCLQVPCHKNLINEWENIIERWSTCSNLIMRGWLEHHRSFPKKCLGSKGFSACYVWQGKMSEWRHWFLPMEDKTLDEIFFWVLLKKIPGMHIRDTRANWHMQMLFMQHTLAFAVQSVCRSDYMTKFVSIKPERRTCPAALLNIPTPSGWWAESTFSFAKGDKNWTLHTMFPPLSFLSLMKADLVSQTANAKLENICFETSYLATIKWLVGLI